MGFLSKSAKNTSGQNNALGNIADVPVQAKLRYGQAGDSYEQEADRVADAVVNRSNGSAQTAAAPALGNSISSYVQREADDKAKGAEEEQAAQQEDKEIQKKEEDRKEEPVQKKEEKKEEPIQKKEDKKEEKPVQKKEEKKEEQAVQKKENKKEEPVQKQSMDKKEDEKKVQKKEDKKEEKPVQKKEEKKEEPVQKKEDKKEEKPVQKKDDDRKKEPVQKKEDKKEEPVQKKQDKKEEKPVQKKESNNDKAESPEIEKQIMATKTSGKAMEDDVRKEMEQQFGKDFKNVRIHNDPNAHQLSRKINAQAFTHGNHIYFAEGKYNPQTPEGKRLLAHELTHVVQQGYDVRRKMVQRVTAAPTAPPATAAPSGSTTPTKIDITTGPYANGYIDTGTSEILIPEVSLPSFKQRHTDVYGADLEYKERPNTNQDTQFKQAVEPGVRSKLGRKKAEAEARGAKGASGTYFFKGRRRDSLRIIGRDGGVTTSSGDARTSLLETFIFPIWDRSQEPTTFQVDHRKEMQLNGIDQPANYELLEAAVNGSSGGLIKGNISTKVKGIINEAKPLAPGNASLQALTEKTAKASYKIKFDRVRFNLAASGDGSRFWRLSQISAGDHMEDIIPMSPRDIQQLGDKTNPKVFSSPAGGTILDASGPYPKRNWMPRVDLLGVVPTADGNGLSNLVVRAYYADDAQETGTVHSAGDSSNNLMWNLIPIEGVYGGAIDKNSIKGTLRNSLRLPGLSPIELNSVDILEGQGIMARGKVLPTIPMVRNADIDILITGAEVQLRKTFDAGEITVPSPFQIKDVALTVFLSTRRGIGLEGRVDFGINNVGEGFIGAAASTGGGFELEGEFNFDSTLFEPARVRVNYREQQWSLEGQIGIPQGKVRGIKRGSITLSYANEVLTAQGDIEPDIKGIQRGAMNARFSADGFLISGDFTLSNDIPGIRGGQLSASLEKTGGEYKVKASGSAQPAIPGVNATLSINYDNGALTIEGSAAYQRGLLDGNIRIGATNRAIGPDGQPAGDPTDTFTVYGGGQLTVKITPWLQGTIGVSFLPNGELEVSGRLAIPSPIDVFPRKEIPEQDIFSLSMDIPIFAIPLGPRSIGLKATIGGALKVYAGIGPGKLEQLELGITYNPDHPDDAHVTGAGRFLVPADAGLKLAVRASVGVDAGVAGVEGGFEIAGGLGLQASAEAAVNIDWTPNSGLELNASLSANVQPKFTFNIDGFIKAWLLFYDKEWRWRLANYAYGSNLNFGVKLPIHYKEGEAFNLSYNDIEFQKPDIDAGSFVRGLVNSLM